MSLEDTGTKTWNRYGCKSCQLRQGETYMQGKSKYRERWRVFPMGILGYQV